MITGEEIMKRKNIYIYVKKKSPGGGQLAIFLRKLHEMKEITPTYFSTNLPLKPGYKEEYQGVKNLTSL